MLAAQLIDIDKGATTPPDCANQKAGISGGTILVPKVKCVWLLR